MTAPDHGARITLERERVEGARARYRVEAEAPDAVFSGAVELGEAVTVTWADEPPAWVATFVERLAKGLPRKHAADASWPRRIRRWRAPA